MKSCVFEWVLHELFTFKLEFLCKLSRLQSRMLGWAAGDYSFNYISLNMQNVNFFFVTAYISGFVSSVNVNQFILFGLFLCPPFCLQYPTDCVFMALSLHLDLT